MQLDNFGKIAIAEIVFYVPVACIAFYIALRHGFNRRLGWVFLFTFSMVRIVGSAITIAAKISSKPQVGLFIAATILSGIGLSPLLLATHGFVSKIAQYGLPSSTKFLHLTRIVLVVALVVAVVGGTKQSPDNSASTMSTGRTLTRVGVVLFMVGYLILFAFHIMLWKAREYIPVHHRNLLSGVSLALAPLFVRLVYSLLGAFASSTQSRWSSINGDWRVYLGMGLIMEYLVVVIYVIVGVLTPLQREDDMEMKGGGRSQEAETGRPFMPARYA